MSTQVPSTAPIWIQNFVENAPKKEYLCKNRTDVLLYIFKFAKENHLDLTFKTVVDSVEDHYLYRTYRPRFKWERKELEHFIEKKIFKTRGSKAAASEIDKELRQLHGTPLEGSKLKKPTSLDKEVAELKAMEAFYGTTDLYRKTRLKHSNLFENV